MPKYNPGDDELDAGYGSDSSVEAPEESESTDKQSVDQEEAGEQTAIVSNKILSPDGEPLNEGDEIVVQVVKNYGSESEIKYAPKKGGESEESESEPETMESAAKDFAAMDQEKAY